MGLIFGSSKRQTKATPDGSYASMSSFNHDGLELARVKREKRREFPFRHVFLFLLAVASFKVFLFLDMGAGAYGAKAEALAEGTRLEQIAGWAMKMDPLSLYIVDGLRFGAW